MIALLLTWITIYVARRWHKLRNKRKAGSIAIACVLILCFRPSAHADTPGSGANQGYAVHGTIEIPSDKANVLAYLIRETDMTKPGDGFMVSRIVPAPGAKSVEYSFTGIPRGTYAVRVFLDTNGNGKLDGGMFGPTEPWALSWNRQKQSFPPRFNDISFEIDRDTRIDLVLNGKNK